MKLSRVDWVSALAIAVGTTVGLGLTVRLVDTTEPHGHLNPDVGHGVVLETPTAEVKVRHGEEAEIRLRATLPTLEELEQPLIYVDGVRVPDMAAIEDLSPDRIERIEVIKRGAALEQFGEAGATRGVVQIFLKPAAEGTGRN